MRSLPEPSPAEPLALREAPVPLTVVPRRLPRPRFGRDSAVWVLVPILAAWAVATLIRTFEGNVYYVCALALAMAVLGQLGYDRAGRLRRIYQRKHR